MKFKYYIASILILTIILSIGTVTAAENINETDTSQTHLDNSDLLCKTESSNALQSDESESPIQDEQSSSEETDLSVDMELGDIVKHTYGINEVIFDVPLIITAKANDATAKNTKIYLTIPDDFEYVSHDANLGSYNPTTGIWDIGDLNTADSPKLTIMTKISAKGTFSINVNGTTTSTDKTQSNNALTCNIQVSSKITSNTTRTSADQSGAQHSDHQGSSADGGHTQKEPENTPSESETKPSDTKIEDSQNRDDTSSASPDENTQTDYKTGSDNGQNTNSNNNGESTSKDSKNSAAKEIDSDIFTKTSKTMIDAVNSILNPSSNEDDDSGNSKGAVKAIDIYDYTQIPILIFGLFLVLLIGIYGYDKIKS